ncbi:MAG: hypothetical protein AB7E70_14160 [Hyphomicrobiaceae bacterium]
MTYTLEQFCADCRSALQADPGDAGREAISNNMQELLKNEAFVAEHLGPQVADGRHELYRDPELNFVVLAHVDRTPRPSPPHDHGRSWAVYGQAIGWSEMKVYDRVDGSTGPGSASLELVEQFRLEPGESGIFGVGAIHAVERSSGGCCYVRVTGEDLEVVPRLRYDKDNTQAVLVESLNLT